MKVQSVRYLIFTIVCCISASLVYGWGFWAHQRINRSAVFSLPEEMRRFYYNHIDFISEEAVMPDVRIYAINDKAEANRHYIDMEYLRKSPAETIPAEWKEARARYKDSLLQESGILPWYIDSLMTKLTKAFRDKDKAYILFLSGDLAHYIGDALVVCITTIHHLHHANYLSFEQAERLNRHRRNNKHIKRIFVTPISAWNKAVITRIVEGGIDHAVKFQQAAFFINLIFTTGTLRYLNHCVYDARGAVAIMYAMPGM